jgi:hypothetical protein
MNDIESLLTATLRLRISMRSSLRFSKQTDVSTDINTDFCITEDFFCKEEVFAEVFHFVIVMMMTAMLRKAVRSIL